jgi:hypothetical protein
MTTSVGDEVLIDSSNCGMISFGEGADIWDVQFPYMSARVTNAANYAQQCYSPGRCSALSCTTFATSTLPTPVDRKADCPFQPGSGICKSDDSNLFLDTQFIDSSVHLGLNAPFAERIQFRNTYHCAPPRKATQHRTSIRGLMLPDTTMEKRG